MKVLNLGKYAPPAVGGIEVFVQNLLQELKKEISVELVVANVHQNFEFEEIAGIPTYKIPTLCQIAKTPICLTMPQLIYKLCQKNHYDLVHIHLPNPMAHFASCFLPKSVKVVLTWHSDVIEQKRLIKLYQPFLNHLVQKAHAITGHTPKHFTSSSQLNYHKYREKLYVVPHGLDTAPFQITGAISSKCRELHEKYQGKKLIFALGRHVPYKGFQYLIEAMRYLADTCLLLGGTGPLTLDFKAKMNELGLADRVIFLGSISDEDRLAYYHACDVFCLPSVSKNEAYGLVQLEAMACKKPVVSCELDNGASYVNQDGLTGFVVPPRNAEKLANAIKRLLDDEELQHQMGEAGFQRVRDEFGMDKMREGMLKVYRAVLCYAS